MKSLDLTNQRFGKLFVIGIDENNKYNSSNKKLWKCQCDCGTICYKTTDSLKRPITTPGVEKACSKKCGSAIPIDSRFERLVVIENIFYKNQETECKCKCDCGKIIITKQIRLKNGTTKSCGCYKNDRMSNIGKRFSQPADISNQKFGKLMAIQPTDKRQNKSIIWECICDCGNLHLASVSNLKNGSVSRCRSCQINSKGEEKIEELLLKNNIQFIKQKTFEDCRFPDTNAKLRFDFYVNDSYLIEFDGSQHFIANAKGWNTFEKLDKTQKRDLYKNEWCKSYCIPLIRIPYTALDFLDINDLKLERTKYLV